MSIIHIHYRAFADWFCCLFRWWLALLFMSVSNFFANICNCDQIILINFTFRKWFDDDEMMNIILKCRPPPSSISTEIISKWWLCSRLKLIFSNGRPLKTLLVMFKFLVDRICSFEKNRYRDSKIQQTLLKSAYSLSLIFEPLRYLLARNRVI